MTWALASLVGLGDRGAPGDVTASGTDAPAPTIETGSYRFERIRVVYPFVQRESEEVVEGSAGVQGHVEWTTSTYPGEHQCRIELLGAGGVPVGSLDFGYSNLSPARELHLSLPIPVSAPPETAAMSCDRERLDAPVAFVVSDERIEPVVEDGRVVSIRHSYTVDTPPGVSAPMGVGTNWCESLVLGPSGEVLVKSQFTLYTPTPNTFDGELKADDRFASFSREEIEAMTLDVRCEPFTGGPGQQG
jgi:hypothetical protein